MWMMKMEEEEEEEEGQRTTFEEIYALDLNETTYLD